jgi:hypothetical protein
VTSKGCSWPRSGAERVMILLDLLDLLGQQARVQLAQELIEVSKETRSGVPGGVPFRPAFSPKCPFP